MKRQQLTAHLSGANLQSHFLRACHGEGDGGIVVTPHGARILGMFTQESGDNLYFINPEFTSPASAKTFLAGEHVLGGDRLWLAPERGLFFKGNTLADGVSTQASIDPGNWVVAQLTSCAIRLVHEYHATFFHHPGSVVRGRVERSIHSIRSPFHHTPGLVDLKNVRYAGYEIASRFELLEAPRDDLYFDLWFLIQLVVPHGGFLFAPTHGKTVTTDYFEPTGPDYLRVTDTHVRFKLDSINRHKIGLRKTEVTGRAAFLSNPAQDGNATLVVRNFLNNPSAHYADVPLHTPAGTQDSVQSYNHFTGPEGFGELEFHSPGVKRSMNEPVVFDTNQVWAFTGPRQNLIPIAGKLLGLSAETFSL